MDSINIDDIKNLLKFDGKRQIFNIKQEKLYKQAFIHKSVSEEESNERLEMLGDVVFNAAITDYLYTKYPDCNEGELSKRRMRIINGNTMADIAKKMGMEEIIVTDENIKINGKILEDAFEAFMGAIYIDKGYEVVKKIALRVIDNYITEDLILTNTNYKDIFLQFVKLFDVIDHAFVSSYDKETKLYSVYIRLAGTDYKAFQSTKLKQAEQLAAEYTNETLNITEDLLKEVRAAKAAKAAANT